MVLPKVYSIALQYRDVETIVTSNYPVMRIIYISGHRCGELQYTTGCVVGVAPEILYGPRQCGITAVWSMLRSTVQVYERRGLSPLLYLPTGPLLSYYIARGLVPFSISILISSPCIYRLYTTRKVEKNSGKVYDYVREQINCYGRNRIYPCAASSSPIGSWRGRGAGRQAVFI